MLKRTRVPFWSKDATRLTAAASRAMQANQRDVASDLLREADETIEARMALHDANQGRNRKRFPPNMVNGRMPSGMHLVFTHCHCTPHRRRWS